MPDDLPFDPTVWDLATAIGLVVEPVDDRVALDELADAMLVWADDDESERLTDVAVERIWSDELAGEIRAGLSRAATLGADWQRSADAALAEFDRAPRAAPISRAVVQELAAQLSAADHPFLFCVCCIDEVLDQTPTPLRRGLARRVAIVAARNVDFADDELRRAARIVPAERATAQLATPARRLAVRERLARIGRFARTSMPALAGELEAIGREPLTERPEDDDVWCELCEFVLDGARRPELN